MAVVYDRFNITVEFADRLVGGIPLVRDGDERGDKYEQWARGQGVPDKDAAELGEVLSNDPDMPVATDDVEGMQTGFRRDDDGLYIEARQVKAMLREAAQRLGIIANKRGTRQVLQHDLHVRYPEGGQKLPIMRDGQRLQQADGLDMRPISVVTRQGPRTALKRFEYVVVARVEFQVMILAGGVGRDKAGEPLIDEDLLRDMLEVGGTLGLGADRSQGEGVFEVVEFDRQPADRVG